MKWNSGIPKRPCQCLVKTSTNEIIRLDYTSNWEYHESHIPYSDDDYGSILCWESISSIDAELTDHNEYWAYNFNTSFIESAIPALELWIEKGCSHPNNIDPTVWNEIKKTILSVLVEYSKFEDGIYDNLSKDERLAKWKEVKNIIKVSFHLMGEYFEDMWD